MNDNKPAIGTEKYKQEILKSFTEKQEDLNLNHSANSTKLDKTAVEIEEYKPEILKNSTEKQEDLKLNNSSNSAEFDKIVIETDEYKQEILKSFTEKQEDLNLNNPADSTELDNIWNMNNRIIDLYVENIKQDQDLRSKYAEILINILSFQLLVLMFIFICVGANLLNYSNDTLNIFITGGIAEVFVLVRIIVKYLFKDNLTEAFKIIITTNNKKYNSKNKKTNFKTEKP